MKKILLIAVLALLLGGCVSTTTVSSKQPGQTETTETVTKFSFGFVPAPMIVVPYGYGYYPYYNYGPYWGWNYWSGGHPHGGRR